MARFERVYCSQCGGEFGPRDSGYSHCEDHAGQRNLDNFACRVCGKECPTASAEGAICEDCCEDHQYEYDKWRRNKFCVHCDRQIPDDFYDD